MKTVFTHANLFDGTENANLLENVSVYVDDEKITSIEPSDKPVCDGYKEVDLSGKFLMPGLVNLHAHLFGDGVPNEALGGGEEQEKLLEELQGEAGLKMLDDMVADNARQALYSGVTTIRAVGDIAYSDLRVRNAINDGKIEGPRLLVSGPAVTSVGGHGEGTISYTSNNPAEMEEFIQKNADMGVDLIKIMVTGGVVDAKVKGEPGVVRMTLEQTKAACDKAHSLGLKVASHTESTPGLKIALEGGVDTIEHGSHLTPELIDLYKKHGASNTVTISPALPLARLSPEITKLNDICVYNAGIVLDNIIEGGKQALAAGIPVGIGTDSGCPLVSPHTMWREVYGFAKYCEVSNAFALHTATLKNAQLAGVGDVTGSVESGKFADLIVTDKNPLEDLRALRDVEMVMMRGKLIEHPTVKKNAQIEEWLDSIF